MKVARSRVAMTALALASSGLLASAGALATGPHHELAASQAPPPSQPPDPCSIEGAERVVAIGDVHGAYDAFVGILRAAGLVDEKIGWAGGRSYLVQTGDLVDRGPSSRKVLDLVMRLEREAPAAGGQVITLLGNHEAAVMLGDLRSTSPAEYEEFKTSESEAVRQRAIGEALDQARRIAQAAGQKLDERTLVAQAAARMPPGYVERGLAFGPTGVYGRWLRARPTVVRIDGIAFVHGGIGPSVATLGCAAINASVRADLTTDIDRTIAAPRDSLVGNPDGPLWYRGMAQSDETTFAPAVDTILRQLGARAIVGGHTVVPGGRIATRFNGRVIQIDTGMLSEVYAGGRPSALELNGDRRTAIYLDGRQPLSAWPRQPAAGVGVPLASAGPR